MRYIMTYSNFYYKPGLNKLFFNLLSFFMLYFLFLPSCLALSTDKNEPIELEADSADLNDKKGISIYSGNVILTQGSTQLNANKLTLFHNQQHKLTKVEAIGSPARFKQRPDGQQKDVKAKAKKMLYYVNKETIHLYNNAIFYQGKNSFRGDKIVYDTKNDIVKANSKKSSSGKTKPSGRVKVVIQAEKIAGKK